MAYRKQETPSGLKTMLKQTAILIGRCQSIWTMLINLRDGKLHSRHTPKPDGSGVRRKRARYCSALREQAVCDGRLEFPKASHNLEGTQACNGLGRRRGNRWRQRPWSETPFDLHISRRRHGREDVEQARVEKTPCLWDGISRTWRNYKLVTGKAKYLLLISSATLHEELTLYSHLHHSALS